MLSLLRSKWAADWRVPFKDHVAEPLDGEAEHYLTANIALFAVIEDDLLPLKVFGIKVRTQAAHV